MQILESRHRTGVFEFRWVSTGGSPLLNVYALFLALGSNLGGRSAIEVLLLSSALEPGCLLVREVALGYSVTVVVIQLPSSALLRPRLRHLIPFLGLAPRSEL